MEQVRTWWSALPSGQRRLIVFLTVTTLAVSAVFWALVNRRAYMLLYSDLNPQDVAEVTRELSSRGVPFKTVDNGTSVLVPPDQLAPVRMQLASQGLPQSGAIGFEVFDKTTFMTTDFVQRMQLIRGLQGELARSITYLGPVSSARVHITMPKRAVFDRDRKEPTASVIVSIKSGGRLSLAQAKGIAMLVSRAVEGLSEGSIFIQDTEGKALWTGEEATAPTALTNRRQAMEEEIRGRVQSMLDQTIGLGNSVVRVAAVLETEQRETQTQTIVPTDGAPNVIIEETEKIETLKAPGGTPVPMATGTPSNLATASASGSSTVGGNVNYNKTERSRQYDVSRRSVKVVHLPGGIKQLSVAVLLDSTVIPSTVSTGGSAGTPTKLNSIQKAVASAAGVDFSRGDSVAIESVEFAKAALAPTEQPMDWFGMARVITTSALGIVALVCAVWLARSIMSTWAALRLPPPMEVALEGIGEMPVTSQDEEVMPLETVVDGEEPVLTEARQQVEEARALAEHSPQEVADVIGEWLAEG